MPKASANSPLSVRKRNKESVKQNRIVRELKSQIINGFYLPGNRIPIQTELIKSLGMSTVTVQRALHELKVQGFLTTKGKLGTFVSTRPPHLFDYALIFPQDPNRSAVWSNFYESLRNYAVEYNQLSDKKINFFYGLDLPDSTGELARLEKLVVNHQLAGLIFASPPFEFTKTAIMLEPGIPRVYIGFNSPEIPVPSIMFGGESCTIQAAKYLVGVNATRIAFFATDPASVDYWLKLPCDQVELGIKTRRQWSFAIHAHIPETATACVRLLMDLPPSERPNGIIVMDDHLTEAVELGLLSSSDPTAIEVKIVASCNFPDRFMHQLPVKRLGYEASDIINGSLGVLDALRQGHTVRQMTYVQPHFDDLSSKKNLSLMKIPSKK